MKFVRKESYSSTTMLMCFIYLSFFLTSNTFEIQAYCFYCQHRTYQIKLTFRELLAIKGCSAKSLRLTILFLDGYPEGFQILKISRKVIYSENFLYKSNYIVKVCSIHKHCQCTFNQCIFKIKIQKIDTRVYSQVSNF